MKKRKLCKICGEEIDNKYIYCYPCYCEENNIPYTPNMDIEELYGLNFYDSKDDI